MSLERLPKQIEFIKEIDKIKYIQRKTKLFNSNRPENDAEHSWHLAMMALILLEHANEDVDLLKVIKMVLIHDVVEIDTGDIFLYDTTQSHDNTVEELKAAKRIFGMLPQDQGKSLIALWEEFEAGETKEAKFARAMDRFEPILQNTTNNGGTWNEYQVEFDRAYQKSKVIDKGANTIWTYTEKLMNNSKEKGHFKPATTALNCQ